MDINLNLLTTLQENAKEVEEAMQNLSKFTLLLLSDHYKFFTLK